LPFNYLAALTRLAAVAALLVALGPVPPLQAQAGRGSAEEFASRLQKKYDTVRDFTADFTQTYEGGVLRKKTSERGTVQVKKPGRMRWSYTAPEPKLFVADGEKMYSYVPADRQVVVSRVPRGDEAATPVLFLVGKGNLTRDFSVSFTDVPSAPPNSIALRLLPRQPERDYEWLTLVVDRDTLSLRMLIAGDNQGGTSTFAFANLKENVGLPDSTFSFTIPRGADVINQG
jgi:outer membrane lipoprotein carrier protein